MSELHNPIFDEEKEFLERKKLEYERALRGDVEHIKDQTEKVSKIALVGVGLAGSIWLITKAFTGKKRKPKQRDQDHDEYESDHDDIDTEYFGGSNGRRYQRDAAPKSAEESAKAFMDHHEHAHEADDLGFGATATPAPSASGASNEPAMARYPKPEARDSDAEDHNEGYTDDPFQDLPYDDSRRLPTSHAFDGLDEAAAARRASSRSRMIGAVLQSFLQSDTGKVLVGQVAAVALALVTKKVAEFFPTPKNSDLAASPGAAAAAAGYSSVASSAPSDSPDASTHPQSL